MGAINQSINQSIRDQLIFITPNKAAVEYKEIRNSKNM